MNIKNHVAIFSIWSHLVFSLKKCFRGSKIQKSGETTKRMNRLAPNLVHVCGLIWETTYVGKKMLPLDIPGGHLGFLGGQSLGNLPNGWTNWHQIWYMSANSSRSGHRLKTISPSRSNEGIFGVLRGQMSKGWEDGQTAGPIGTKLWAIYSDGSVNGHRLKKHWPCETPGGAF